MIRRTLGIALLALAAVGCASSGAPSTATTDDTASSVAFRYGRGACPPATPPPTRPTSFDDAPQRCIEDGVDYGATIVTSEGTITVDLDEKGAPGTVNNFVALARWGWFNGGGFHRVVPGFVIQAGDVPAGRGRAGYTIPDENPSSLAAYKSGTLAMANAGPNTGATQWFVCIDCTKLPAPDYPAFGQVTSGMDVVARIEALGTGDGPPSRPVTIQSVTITER